VVLKGHGGAVPLHPFVISSEPRSGDREIPGMILSGAPSIEEAPSLFTVIRPSIN